MSTTHYPCDLCGRPSGDDAPVCVSCADQAAAALRQVSEWLAEDLVTATARQTALGGRSGGKPTKASEAPLPLDLRASEAATVLRSTLAGWIRVVADDGAAGSLPADTLQAMAAWLAPVVQWIRTRPYGAEAVDEILAGVRQAVRAVDRPIRYVPLPQACRAITLVGQTPVACGGALRAVIAPGLPSDGQVRCEVDRRHTSTVAAEEAERRRATRVRAHLRTA
ncbi:hypothetical protein AB0I72_00575 [Nocardiopsis sp. NPDC049922]|uniref:hypothetical protein n=1 Tax=Nocardiopsis sp. NPDC049922 TaxID=3155157 RepID=UPI0033E0DF57